LIFLTKCLVLKTNLKISQSYVISIMNSKLPQEDPKGHALKIIDVDFDDGTRVGKKEERRTNYCNMYRV